MSLINQMLQELEQRGEQENMTSTRRYTQFGSNTPVAAQTWSKFLVWILLAAALSVLLWFFLAKRNDTGTPSINESQKVVSQVAATSSPNELSSATSVASTQLPAIADLPLLLKLSTQVSLQASQADGLSPEAQKLSNTSLTGGANKIIGKDVFADDGKDKPVTSVEKVSLSSQPDVTPHKISGQTNKATESVVDAEKSKPAIHSNQKNETIASSNKAMDNNVDGRPPTMIKEISPQQGAEGQFRQATVYQQQGRTTEAVNALQQALLLDAQHAPARQLLISMLLDNNRQDEAIRELKQGLALDPQQINFAMILARLQVERAKLSDAIETLQRGLPVAQERPDYLAFLAALYQKTGQHKDAIQLYRLALKRHTQNGVWWMGLGISLQADASPSEAIEAYKQAKQRSGLSAELQAFIDQKLAQLQK